MNLFTAKNALMCMVCVCTLLSPAVFARQQTIDSALQRKAQLLSPDLAREIHLMREERRAESQELTTHGMRLMEEGKYREAYVALSEAVRLSEENITAKTRLRTVNDILYDVYAGYGQSRMQVRDYEGAINHFRMALEHKPEGQVAIRGIRTARERIEASVSQNLGRIISDAMDKDEQVDLLIRQARDLEVQSRYEEAKALYKEAISIQTANPRPRRLLKELIDKQGRIIADDRRIERRQIMEDLIKAFFRYPDGDLAEEDVVRVRELTPEAQRRQELIRKLQVTLETVSFRDATVQEVISYLADISDVNIILDLGERAQRTITIELFNPTILDAINYITESQGLTYMIDQYALIITHGEGEMETRFWSVSAQAITTAAEVDAAADDPFAAFDLFADDTFAVDDPFDDISAEPEIVRIIKDSVPQPTGSSIFLEPTTGTLIARNTPANLDDIDAIIEELEHGIEDQVQVEIQTRFVEMSDQDLKNFSFSISLNSPWTLGRQTRGGVREDTARLNATDLTGALRRYTSSDISSRYANRVLPEVVERMVGMAGMSAGQNQVTDSVLGFFTSAFSDPEFSIILHALENETNADILSAPTITTLSGESRVTIRQITEVMYPDQYTVYKPAVLYDAGVGQTFQIRTPRDVRDGYATVENTLKEDVGIELIVSPTISEDNTTVSMDITTRVSSEIEPHQVIAYVGNVVLGTSPIILNIPRFRNAEVKTQVVVNDGETIVLGGMITEQIRQYNDKVPFWGDLPMIGRFFRNDGTYQSKKNLLIFVTTRIITPSGERYKIMRERMLREEEQRSQDEIDRIAMDDMYL